MAEAKIDIILSNGAKAGETLKELTKTANTLNKELKDLKPGSEEFINKSKDLQQVNDRMKGVKDQINGTTKASHSLKDAFLKFVPFGDTFGKIGQSISGATGSVGGLTNSFGLLKGAIAATGIGLLVVAVGTLVDWFRKTDEGATLMAGIMRGLGAVMDKLTKVVRDFGGWLMMAIENPKQAFQDFADFIKNQMINRFNAFGVAIGGITKIIKGDFKEGMKQLADATIQATLGIENGTDKIIEFGKEIAKTVQEGIDLEVELDRIADRARELAVLDAEAKKTVDQLLLQSKNVGKSYEERIALLDKASAVELANHKQQLANAIDLEKAIARDVAQKQAVGKVSDDLDQQYKDAQIARIELERESISIQEKIDNRRTALMEKQGAEREKDFARQQKLEQDLFKEQQAIEDLRLKLKGDSRTKDIEQLELSLTRQIEALDMNSELYNEHVKAITETGRAARNAINTAWDQKELEEKLKLDETAFAIEQNHTNELFLHKQISEQEFLLRSETSALDFQRRKLDKLREAHGEESLEYQRAYGEYIELQQAQADSAVAIKNKEMQDQKAAMMGALGAFDGFFGQLAGMQKKGTEDWKAFATAQAVMSTIQSSINAYQSTAAIPIVGPILAPIAAGLALAAGYQRVREIQRTKVEAPVKKEKGGLLKGPRHSQGGILIEAEGDEFIFSRKAVEGIGVDELNRINNHYTRKMAIGGPVNPFQSTSSGSTAAASTTTSPFGAGNESIVNELRSLRGEVASWPQMLKVQNVVTETEDVLNVVNTIREEADV